MPTEICVQRQVKHVTACRDSYHRCIAALCLFFSVPLFAMTFSKNAVYVGVNVGGGSTEWKYLVDKLDENGSLNVSTPSKVTEGGPSWGAVLGFAANKNFALELQYMRFADAEIEFSPFSTYTAVDGISSMRSKTDALSLSAKFLAQIMDWPLRAFAAVGPTLVQRDDVLAKKRSCITPYMSAGLVYNVTPRWMIESGFQYYTGFGRSELHPVRHFIPFAWDAYARLAYQIV